MSIEKNKNLGSLKIPKDMSLARKIIKIFGNNSRNNVFF